MSAKYNCGSWLASQSPKTDARLRQNPAYASELRINGMHHPVFPAGVILLASGGRRAREPRRMMRPQLWCIWMQPAASDDDTRAASVHRAMRLSRA